MTGDQQTENDVIVGIDLGTTNSLVAIYQNGEPRVLSDGAITPSVVRYDFTDDRWQPTVGRSARDAQIESPLRTVSSVKRLMGRSFEDVGSDADFLGYEIGPGERNTVVARVKHSDAECSYSPEQVSADILRHLKQLAERDLGHAVSRAVVTVPAYFDDAQRQATRDAGRLAGLDVVRIVNEPTAAALAYGIGTRAQQEPSTIVVYDLGGGTFDVSVLRLTPGAGDDSTEFFQVLSTAGDTRLGGDDVDRMLVELFAREIAEQLGQPELSLEAFSPETRRALVSFAEQVKVRLSEAESAAVQIQINADTLYERLVTRQEFESLLSPWVERSLEACRIALRDAERAAGKKPEIDAIVMVGGSTRIPLVRQQVSEFFSIEPYVALDPDRVVALGAAIQAGILSGAAAGSLLLDVIPLSLGIETRGGAAAKLIVRNSSVPARATEMFSTSVDGQTSIALHIVQGEREMAEDCRSLGRFELSGLPPMPAGIPQLEVEFLVDANGVLRVTAHERRSGKRASLQVVPSHGLTRDQVDRMEAESFEHARDDMTRHRIVDLIENSRLDLKWIGERLDRFQDALDSEYAAGLRAQMGELSAMITRATENWRSVDADAFYQLKESLARDSVRLQEVSIAASLREDG